MQRTAFGLFVALAFSVVAPLASAETTSAVAAFEKDLMLAKEGDVDAQFRLGSRYVKGEGVPIGVMKAIGWYRRAADKGGCCRPVQPFADLRRRYGGCTR